MIDIIAKGVALDLDLSSEFQIEIDNPLFETDSIPTSWSTTISFNPTHKNCEIFGYIEALMFEPQVKRLPADIYISAQLLISGNLEYDSIEDGLLKYTFTSKSISDSLSNDDISNNSILPTSLKIYKDDASGRDIYSDEFKSIRANKSDIIKSPLLVIKGTERETMTSQGERDHLINIFGDNGCMFIPAGQAYAIAMDARENRLIVDDAILDGIKMLYILGQYKPIEAYSLIGFDESINFNDTLPKISKLDLIANIGKIFAASYYTDGDSIKLIPSASILSSKAKRNWDGKVSDVYSSYVEEASAYSFGFADDSSDNSYQGSSDDDGSIQDAESYYDVALNRTPPEDGKYLAVRHRKTGDIFSFTRKLIGASTVYGYPIDCILRKSENIEMGISGSDNSFDNSVAFKVVRCVPEALPSRSGSYDLKLAPIVSPPSRGDERGSDAIIGIISDGQMCEKGIVIAASPNSESSGVDSFIDKDLGFSLQPGALYKWHGPIAVWLSAERQRISVKLNLDIFDIAGFKIYEKVYFKGREWIVKSLSIQISVSKGITEISGEFVSA